MVIALADSLVYYNFNEGNSQTLLHGIQYQCITQIPIVIYLPDSLFVYIKDQLTVSADPEVWTVFDSDSNHLFTQISTDPGLLMNYVSKSTGSGNKRIQGRWYIPAITSDNRTCSYECSLIEPDSLHVYFAGSPGSINESTLSFSPFTDNRILRLCYDDFIESIFMYCNYVPLEQFSEVISTYYWGYSYPVLTAITTEITTMTVRLQNQIAILALWGNDFPVVHEFYFPASSDYLGSTSVFADNSFLRVITNQKLYSFYVGISSSIADETLENIDRIIMAYPNPVRTSQQLMITSMSKEPSIFEIYNIRGQKVQTLEMGKSGQIEWDLRDHENLKLPSGVYIIKSRNRIATKPCKLVLIN